MLPCKRHRTVRPDFAADQSAFELLMALQCAENEGWPLAREAAVAPPFTTRDRVVDRA
jgi:hypothetical protein